MCSRGSCKVYFYTLIFNVRLSSHFSFSGFCVELGSASTVLIASNLGIPISTTHCQVGSVCGVGWLRTRKAVDWPLFSGIFFAWVVTLPATMMLSSGLMGFLQHVVPGGCELVPIPLDNSTAIATTLGLV